MSFPSGFNWLATAAFERMLYGVCEGTVLAIIVWALLRASRRTNSGTRFVVWFSTLLVVPLLSIVHLQTSVATASQSRPMLMLPAYLAVYVFLGWLAVAVIGLARVLVGIWQLKKVRQQCVAVSPEQLPPEVCLLIEKSGAVRPVEVLVSDRVEVPTAIGFFRPSIVLPCWLLEQVSAAELKFVVLHELAHLLRRDDWTNLTQKVLKAIFFFHPSVWWIEGRLSLEREMACDDLVLAQLDSPHGYAECLTHVAEKSFLCRQLALAQAAVSRMRQLSLRVTRILDGERPRATTLWKPAVPVVAALSMACIFFGSRVPDLVGFSGPANLSGPSVLAGKLQSGAGPATRELGLTSGRFADPKLLSAPAFVPAKFEIAPARTQPEPKKLKARPRKKSISTRALLARNVPAPGPVPYVVREEVFFVFRGAGPNNPVEQNVEMRFIQLRFVIPSEKPQKPPQKI